MEKEKIKSVLELAKYKPGEVLYWVTLRPVGSAGIHIPEGEDWLTQCHPKVLHDRKLISKAWRYRNKIPKLCAIDFQYVVDLLTSEPVVEQFVVHGITRSPDTGEFYYANDAEEWMPQGFLFKSVHAARKEKKRIKDMFRVWANQTSDDEV
jgi:hypothetical protein